MARRMVLVFNHFYLLSLCGVLAVWIGYDFFHTKNPNGGQGVVFLILVGATFFFLLQLIGAFTDPPLASASCTTDRSTKENEENTIHNVGVPLCGFDYSADIDPRRVCKGILDIRLRPRRCHTSSLVVGHILRNLQSVETFKPSRSATHAESIKATPHAADRPVIN